MLRSYCGVITEITEIFYIKNTPKRIYVIENTDGDRSERVAGHAYYHIAILNTYKVGDKVKIEYEFKAHKRENGRNQFVNIYSIRPL